MDWKRFMARRKERIEQKTKYVTTDGTEFDSKVPADEWQYVLDHSALLRKIARVLLCHLPDNADGTAERMAQALFDEFVIYSRRKRGG